VHIKVWPAVVAGLFAVQWPRRLIGPLAACTVALGLIPFLTQSPRAVATQYSAWYQTLANRQAGGGRYPGYRDALTLWQQIRSPVNPHAYLALQAAGGLAVLAWCWWQRRRGIAPAQLATYTIAAWCVWQLLLGPGTERLTYNIIAPALAWGLLSSFYDASRSAWQTFCGRAWILTAYTTTFLLGIGSMERLMIERLPQAIALEPVGVLIFGTWLVWHAAHAAAWSASTASLPHEPAATPLPSRAA
jgi:hypothetical protein